MKAFLLISFVAASIGGLVTCPGGAAAEETSSLADLKAVASVVAPSSITTGPRTRGFSARKAQLPQCVEKDQACTIGGTPCCNNLTCKGRFPNTTCQ